MLLNLELNTDAVQQALDAALKKALSPDNYGRNVFSAEVAAIIARGVLTDAAVSKLNIVLNTVFCDLVNSVSFKADLHNAMRDAVLDAAKKRAVKKVGPLLAELEGKQS